VSSRDDQTDRVRVARPWRIRQSWTRFVWTIRRWMRAIELRRKRLR
jgi:hypothetical protein